MLLLGGIRYILFGPTFKRYVTTVTGILVERDRISGIALCAVGSRCCTMTKAMPVSGGMGVKNCCIASSPPAEAPMPTILDLCGTDVLASSVGARRLARWLGPFPPPGSGFTIVRLR